MNRPLLIYVAGPYTAPSPKETMNNVNAAIDSGIEIFRLGHYPYIPHLTHFVDERAKERSVPMKWEDYIKWDLPWLERCDGLLCLGSSPGVRIEVARAVEMGKTIYRSIHEIPPADKVGDSVATGDNICE